MQYYHVDVFTEVPLSGNSLTIFFPEAELSYERMLRITQEMRHFESIFLRQYDDGVFDARVFTVEEELTFAGHPSLGAAAQLHALYGGDAGEARWMLRFPRKSLPIVTRRTAFGFVAEMNQGKAVFGEPLAPEAFRPILDLLDIDATDDRYPVQVVSTGLDYLLVPLRNGFTQARIGAPGLSPLLEAAGAKFIGLVDVDGRSIRTGDNEGRVEDIATGSLAGPAGAYFARHGAVSAGTETDIVQGVHLGRESHLYVTVRDEGVFVRGGVVLLAGGRTRF